MEGFILLFALSLAMFFGSYFAGALPLVVSFSESKLRLITVLGAGLLVGTALAVIIPEGVQSIYTAQIQSLTASLSFHNEPVAHHLHGRRNEDEQKIIENLVVKPIGPESGDRLPSDAVGTFKNKDQHHDAAVKVPQPLENPQEAKQRVKRDARSTFDELDSSPHQHTHNQPHAHDTSGHVDVHSLVGLALVAGFVFMLLVDQLAQSRLSAADVETGGAVQPRYKITATIGLVVHAAADGVALGAASGSTHTDVQFIVFVAIMLHKAPASFGLVTFLMHEGLDKSRIRKHLLIFSSSAPIAAILTFVFITQGGHESLTSLNTTGVLLLFSAGTFLYVATVHVLPEVAAGGHAHGVPLSAGAGQANGFKLNELIALVAGAVLPTVLTVGHSH